MLDVHFHILENENCDAKKNHNVIRFSSILDAFYIFQFPINQKQGNSVSYSKNGDIGLKTILGKKILGAASDHSPDKRPGIRTRKGRPWTQTGTI